MKPGHRALFEAVGHIEAERFPPVAPERHHAEHRQAVLPEGVRVSDTPRELGWGQEVEIEDGAALFEPTPPPEPPTAEEIEQTDNEHGALIAENFDSGEVELPDAEMGSPDPEAQRFISELFGSD